MNLSNFIEQNQTHWRELDELVKRANKNIAGLSESELERLGRIYRMATSDLALAQREFAGHNVTTYLNQLVGRSHSAIYRGEPMRWQAIRSFYAQTLPALVQQIRWYILASLLVFLIPAVIAYLVVWQDPDFIYVLMGPEIAELVSMIESGELWTEIAPTVRASASTAILTNNIQVMFITFAGGVTAGLLTVYVLAFNGLHLGAVFGLLQAHSLSYGLTEFIMAHGFIELSVIFVAGGCGLFMGDGLLRPGLQGRVHVLVERSKQAVQIILGCMPLLILAGIIEGFISPSTLPWWMKLLVGMVTGAVLWKYWLSSGVEHLGTISRRAGHIISSSSS